jgi:C4-dicarboxylate transporter
MKKSTAIKILILVIISYICVFYIRYYEQTKYYLSINKYDATYSFIAVPLFYCILSAVCTLLVLIGVNKSTIFVTTKVRNIIYIVYIGLLMYYVIFFVICYSQGKMVLTFDMNYRYGYILLGFISSFILVINKKKED